MFKLARAGISKSNAARNLHKILETSGVMLPVKPDCILITIKRKKKKNRLEQMWFPVLRMTSWIECLLKECPPVLLAGHQLEDRVAWEHTFANFWQLFRHTDPGHPIFSTDIPLGQAIPYLVHGDEGRGLRKVPWMVESWQLLISYAGIMVTNESTNLHIN